MTLKAFPGSRGLRRLGLGVTVATLLVPFASPSAVEGVDEQTIIEELKAPEDPTIVRRRVWADVEWNSFKTHSNDVDTTLGGLWAWALSANWDWAVRLKLPLRTHVAGDAPDDSTRGGLGDIKLATGTAVRLHETWRVAGGVEMRFPSATNDLGSNVWRPQLFVSTAWDVMPRLTYSPSAEYNKSIAEKARTAPQEFLELFSPLTVVLPDHWSVTPRYEVKIDFTNHNRLTHSVKLQVTKQLERLPLGFSLSIKKPFDDAGGKSFQINWVTTYYFR